MPQQLIALHAGGANGHLNMRLVSWLTKLEKADSPVSTRVFRLVAVLD